MSVSLKLASDVCQWKYLPGLHPEMHSAVLSNPKVKPEELLSTTDCCIKSRKVYGLNTAYQLVDIIIIQNLSMVEMYVRISSYLRVDIIIISSIILIAYLTEDIYISRCIYVQANTWVGWCYGL